MPHGMRWWKARPTRYDADVPVRERWLFPGPRLGKHLTATSCCRRRCSRCCGSNLPGGCIFTCLYHDIIAHEVTHAIVHRLRPHFLEATNEDVRAARSRSGSWSEAASAAP